VGSHQRSGVGPGKDGGGILQQGRRAPTAVIRTEGREVPFNKKATRWLGIWLDTQLTLGGAPKGHEEEG
jgi:hypothetical protein